MGSVKQADWLNRDDLNFDLSNKKRSTGIIDKIGGRSVFLGEFATAYFGIQTHNRKEYVSKEPIGTSWKPAIDGANIRRYSLIDPVEYVKCGTDCN